MLPKNPRRSHTLANAPRRPWPPPKTLQHSEMLPACPTQKLLKFDVRGARAYRNIAYSQTAQIDAPARRRQKNQNSY